MARIVKKIFDVIFVIVIIILALYFVLRAGDRIRIYNVMTGSMENNIHAGDYILILKQDNYEVGDIVTFVENNYYITHRIIKKDGNIITTKGDANNTEDGTINQSKVVGKVVLIGGILNIIIKYKFVLIGSLISIYFLSFYFDERKNGKVKNDFETSKNEDDKKENDNEIVEIIDEEKQSEKIEIDEKTSHEESKTIDEKKLNVESEKLDERNN